MAKTKATKKRGAQIPLNLRNVRKTQARTQFAALCYRVRKSELQVCLVTTRRTKRWILPKGWPMHKQTPADAAATEAWEEAGLKGRAFDHCLGVFSAVKPLGPDAPVIVMVYPLKVKHIASDFPEATQRVRKWVSRKKAARLVDEPELARILLDFDPARLKKSPF